MRMRVCMGWGRSALLTVLGGLKVANTTAQAFAEKSPVIIMSGAPGIKERTRNPLLHHKVKDFDTQLKVFEQFTIAATALNNSETAFREIDRVLAMALRYKRPVYIELPRDVISLPGVPSYSMLNIEESIDPNILSEALKESEKLINSAKQPVIIAGIEVHRFGLHKRLLQFIEQTNIPVAATLLSKSVIAENHPRYLGVYEGAMGHADVRKYVESSDCLILLGTFMTDINLGIYTAHLEQGRSIYSTSEKTSIRYHSYEGVQLGDFIQGLLHADIQRRVSENIPHPIVSPIFQVVSDQKITVQRLFQRLNAFLDDNTVVISDTGDAMFAAADLLIHQAVEFLSPAYYTSLGFAIPASVGVQIGNPNLRPLVLVGDGAFQMTGMELTTVARYGLNPIVIVLNNSGYGTERPMQDGAFNDLLVWRYSRIPEILGKGQGFDIYTEGELEEALRAAREYTESFCILDIHLDLNDRSPALQRLTAMLAKRVQAKQQ